MSTRLICRSSIEGGHIVDRFFFATNERTPELAGELRFSKRDELGQWQLFGAALLLGAGLTHGRLQTTMEGDAAVLAAVSDEEE